MFAGRLLKRSWSESEIFMSQYAGGCYELRRSATSPYKRVILAAVATVPLLVAYTAVHYVTSLT